MTKLIGKVAKILDNRTLVINIGLNNNVQPGMKFLILSSSSSQVEDPDTKEIIGTVKIPKIRVIVIKVAKKYSIAETYEDQTINEGGSMHMGFAKMFEPPKLVKKYKTFEIDSTQKYFIEEAKSVIQIGDIAEEIEDNSK